jgi:Rap1a immunity proteins
MRHLPQERRSRAAAFALIVVLSAHGTASAQQPAPTWTPKTGKELAAECHASDSVKRAACIGYVTGIYDLQFAPTPPQGVCPPPNLNPENLTAVVTAYIDTHEDGPAPAAVAQSIVRFFPCTSQEQRRR